ncbi:MAG: ATP-binding cassette domain-containing protein [Armatimonadetes bacterium]|nr:ATP-binding cassette domain-containing protein [Armatimonadota bacterium]
MITVDSLTKHFVDSKRGIVRAVEGVSFESQPGEIFGLLGANGAGKTTLMRMLSTVITPTSGSATISGYDVVRDAAQVRRNIGFMSSTTALYTRLTAKEMIVYMGRLYGLGGRDLDRRVAEVIQMLQIADFQHRLCDKISTGQKQRVSLARTILHDPPVLFFDEPTAGLDVLASRTIMEFIEERRTSGKTVVFCTHIMSEAERLCDRICVLHNGKVAAIGTLDELKTMTGEEGLEKVFLSLVSGQEAEVA